MARNVVLFGFSGAGDPTGAIERDTSFFLTAHTLKLHLERRFPADTVEVVCAWHKDTFVNILRAPGDRIRQIHYVGHGIGGGLYFGYHNPVASASRQIIADFLGRLSTGWFAPPERKRILALLWDAGLMPGFFSHALTSTKLAEIRAQLLPGALMHVWGCFAGAPTHTFDAVDPYWDLFNAGAPPVDGIARHIAKTLQIETTACRDPGGVHGMDFCHRTAKDTLNCTDVRPGRLPHWLWPKSPKVRWITHDPTGAGDETTINFLGTRMPATSIPPGQPPTWLLKEIPITAAEAKIPPFPACSAARTGI
jgi:hypothetical protein